jgi:toxin ParE1/3/4
MNRKLVINVEARRDVVEQFLYLAERSEAAAERFWSATESTFQKLALQPRGEWLRFPEAELQHLRLWHVDGFHNHLIFYRDVDNVIEIFRVLHGARDWQNILRAGAGTY